MIDQESIRKLREMNFSEMVEILMAQQQDTEILMEPFDSRLERAIEYVYTCKHNNKIARMVNGAKFRFNANIHDLMYEGRSLDRHMINELSTCSFIRNHTNIILQGFTGSGKTYIACALGKAACYNQIRTLYIRYEDLILKYEEVKNDDTRGRTGLAKLINKFSSIPLLIIDEWLMDRLSEEEAHFIFEIVERRYDTASTIFYTQYRQSDWLERLGNDTHAEAIMDRIIHNAVTIETGEKNMREALSKKYLF